MSRVIDVAAIGCRVPGAFRARVHSVFHTAANLAVEGMDHLLTLIASDSMDLPQGIRLPAGETDAIQRLQPGQEVLCQESVIRSVRYPYEINLRRARKYDGSIECPGLGKVAVETYCVAWDLLARRQAEKQANLHITDLAQMLREEPDTEIVAQAVTRNLASLVHAARRLDLEQAAAAIQSMVGLGGGLTPTGDDVLVGFLAGLRASAGAEMARVYWIEQASKELRVASSGTNDISRTYLILAADGQFSSSLKNLAVATCTGEPAEKVIEATETAFQVGHTSGLDAAAGLLAGLAAWQDGLIPNSSFTER